MSFADTIWDDLESGADRARPTKPFWALDLKQDDEVLDWLNGELSYIKEQNERRIRNIERNMALYKSIQYRSQETRTDARDRIDDRSRVVQKVVSNQLFDLAQHRIARLVKFKPAVKVLPTNDEFEDKVSAKLTQGLLDHIFYTNKFEGDLTLQIARNAMVQGESYIFVTWDPDKGDVLPEYKDLAEKNKAPKFSIVTEEGDRVTVDKPIKTGDVVLRIRLAHDVYPERRECWEDVNYIFYREWIPVDELKTLYPNKSKEIKAKRGRNKFDFERLERVPVGNDVEVWHFYHKRHRAFDKGAFVTFTSDLILDVQDFPYSHHNLPCIRFTDDELPGELHGVSFFDRIKGISGAYNNLTNMALRNQILVSHPKWMMPKGTAKLDSLGNDITVVQYQGPVAPQLVQASPTPPELFAFRQELKEEMQQSSGISGVSRGEPPPGIKAGVALQFLNEQESERFNELTLKWNELIRLTSIMTIAVAGDHYDSDDERFIRVVGKSNEWTTVFFDSAHLSKDYDIRVQSTSALPQSVAARIQTIFDLNERFPDRFTADQVIDMLDLAQNDKFVDDATVNVRHAEAENEMILEGVGKKKLIEPEVWEDHLVHWRIHVRQMQEYAYKFNTPNSARKRLQTHVMIHEMHMVDIANRNPLYAEQLATLPGFPLFFRAPNVQGETLEAAEELASPPAEGGAFEVPGQAVNPEQGLEQQAPVNNPPESVEQQVQQGAPAPEPPPVEQSRSI